MRLHLGIQPFALALLVAQSSTLSANTKIESTEELETISVTGSYLEGYNAHSASGASRMALAIEDIPQSVSVITSAQLQDFQLTDVNLALDSATGVKVERIETDRTYYTARGFDITNFQIDGIGLPLTNGNNHAGSDTAVYDRIEVIRGANGLMAGVGNPSATVNYIRKRPTADNFINLKATLASHNLHRLEADGSYQFNDIFSARAVAVDQEQDSYLDRYHKKNSLLYVFLNADLSSNTALSFSHSYNNSDAHGVLWGALPLFYTDGSATNYARSTSTAADWSNWQVITNNSVVELSHVFNNNWHLRATYSQKRTNEDSELFYVYGTPDRETELGLTGYASEYLLDDKHDLYDVYIEGDFRLWGRDHQLVAGLNYSKLAYTDRSLYDYTTGNGFPAMPNLNDWQGDAVFPTLKDAKNGSNVIQRQRAAYLTGRFNVIDDLHVLVGGRFNEWQAAGKSYGVSTDVADSDFIPYMGAVYAVTENVNLYASYTETFQAQNEVDINNQQLDPVIGESQEIGVKTNLFNSRAVASISYFDVQQSNLAIADPATVNLPPTAQRFIGSDGISSSGFEFDIAGEILPGLNTSVGITDFTISGDEQVSKYTPSTLVKIGAVYDLRSFEGLSVGLNVRWQAETSRAQGVVADGFINAGAPITTTQPAYAVSDLLIKYAFNQDISLNLNVFNLTNKKYLTSLYWDQSYYAAPRTVSATLSWSL